MKVIPVTMVVALAPLALLGALTFLSANTRTGQAHAGRKNVHAVPAYPLTSAQRAHFER